jgi:hypothetical protein
MSESRTSARSSKLRTLLVRVLFGKQDITATNAKLFLEAICEQPDPATCIQRLLATLIGLPALQSSLGVDVSFTFLNGPLTAYLKYFQSPELKGICGGQVLQQVVLKIVDPPFVWNPFVQIVRSGQITEDGLDGFSWLLLQLVSLSTEKATPYLSVVREEQIRKKLLGSPRLDVRKRAHRIIHIFDTITTSSKSGVDGPGGRHDNDFADIQQIEILPNPDELASKNPFLRRADETCDDNGRLYGLAIHKDNLFRLGREDMSRDLREEPQVALSPKKGPRERKCY